MTDKANSKAGEPMDPGFREVKEGTPHVARERNCYAMDTLINEVERTFPGADHTVTRRNGRGVATGMMFVSADPDLLHLFGLMEDPAYNADGRLETVIVDGKDPDVLIEFVNNPRVYDDRSPFGIFEAYAIFSGLESM